MIRISMNIIIYIKSFLVNIKTVAVFHNELSCSQDTTFWPCFISEFSLDLVPYLGEVTIGLQLPGRKPSHNFLMSHTETHISSRPVLQTKHFILDFIPSTGFLPYFSGV